ncbi:MULTISPECIES: hypothetical protein [unclassified Duganella]|uniref:hypothetical protein n=1 Tax=unclassified Duganella TaxID=2636909 RepID=UPI0008940673|nr:MULTISPECIES: hypothetical protein [unclassified Duganella]OEZ63877.1 hypothetical protein DUGA6_03780 [Duganella sp. HH105]OFA06970.1 hypothetical protein DUGA2_03020 [Duganella sp. HH101]
MKKLPPLVIELPRMSDKCVVEMHRCLGILLAALETNYEMQLRRYYTRHPQHERPERFGGEPF